MDKIKMKYIIGLLCGVMGTSQAAQGMESQWRGDQRNRGMSSTTATGYNNGTYVHQTNDFPSPSRISSCNVEINIQDNYFNEIKKNIESLIENARENAPSSSVSNIDYFMSNWGSLRNYTYTQQTWSALHNKVMWTGISLEIWNNIYSNIWNGILPYPGNDTFKSVKKSRGSQSLYFSEIQWLELKSLILRGALGIMEEKFDHYINNNLIPRLNKLVDAVQSQQENFRRDKGREENTLSRVATQWNEQVHNMTRSVYQESLYNERFHATQIDSLNSFHTQSIQNLQAMHERDTVILGLRHQLEMQEERSEYYRVKDKKSHENSQLNWRLGMLTGKNRQLKEKNKELKKELKEAKDNLEKENQDLRNRNSGHDRGSRSNQHNSQEYLVQYQQLQNDTQASFNLIWEYLSNQKSTLDRGILQQLKEATNQRGTVGHNEIQRIFGSIISPDNKAHDRR